MESIRGHMGGPLELQELHTTDKLKEGQSALAGKGDFGHFCWLTLQPSSSHMLVETKGKEREYR